MAPFNITSRYRHLRFHSLVVASLLWLYGATLSGCTSSFSAPRNIANLELAGYQAESQPVSSKPSPSRFLTSTYRNVGRCADMDLAQAATSDQILSTASHDRGTLLSPGDLLRIEIARGEGFQGDYVIASDGYVRLPYLGDIPAAGASLEDLEYAVSRLLVSGDYFRPGFVRVGVSVLQWAPVQVSVSGAVFQPGDVLLNERNAKDDANLMLEASGDFSTNRTLTSALFAAAGVRPDADLKNVILVRGGKRRILDFSSVLNGGNTRDPLLIAGDRIHVPSRECFQLALARPSRITPPGVRVFMSNLSRPAASNASSAIGREATSLPYGTRFLQGLVSANCVGGTQATNARRWAVLISRNPITGESEVIARSIEDLVRRADRDDFNPVLLPNDAIACYDSHVTNVRDVLSVLSESTLPALNAALLGGLAE